MIFPHSTPNYYLIIIIKLLLNLFQNEYALLYILYKIEYNLSSVFSIILIYMKLFKKYQFFAIIILSIVALTIGIKFFLENNLSNLENIKILISSVIAYLLFLNGSFCYCLKDKYKYRKTYIIAIISNLMSFILWLCVIWGQFDISRIALNVSCLSILFTNFSAVNIIESNKKISYLLKHAIKLTTIILYIEITLFSIINYVYDVNIVIITFIILCFFDFTCFYSYYISQKEAERDFTLVLKKGSTENIYTDKKNNLYKVTKLN